MPHGTGTGLEEPKTDTLTHPCDTGSPAEGGLASGGESELCHWSGRLVGCQQALRSEGGCSGGKPVWGPWSISAPPGLQGEGGWSPASSHWPGSMWDHITYST